MSGLNLLAPLFVVFEIWHLVMSERYLGIKQIARGGDPREMGPSEPVAFLWTLGIALYGAWALALLTDPRSRGAAMGILAITAVGYAVRRNVRLNLILVVITFESAVRLGFAVDLGVFAWRHLR